MNNNKVTTINTDGSAQGVILGIFGKSARLGIRIILGKYATVFQA